MWSPTGIEQNPIGAKTAFDTTASDWLQWNRLQNRMVGLSSRPDNELMLVRNVSFADNYFPGMYPLDQPPSPEQVMIDAILLQATAALWKELQERLERNFTLCIINDVFTEWEDISSKHWGDHRPQSVLSSWTIQNVEERNKRLELEKIDRFPDEYGCPLEVFVKALNDADAKKATGPAPAPYTRGDRVARQLKKAGYKKITPSVAERFYVLLQKHRPELFPRAPAASTAKTPTVLSAGEKIVPFRKPSGRRGPDDDGPAAA